MFSGGGCFASALLLANDLINSSSRAVGPFLITYLASLTLTLQLPVYFLFSFLRHRLCRSCSRNQPPPSVIQECKKVSPVERTAKKVAKFVGKILGLGALFTVFVYALLRALTFGHAFEVCGKFVAYSNFLYLLWWVILEHRFFFLRVRLVTSLPVSQTSNTDTNSSWPLSDSSFLDRHDRCDIPHLPSFALQLLRRVAVSPHHASRVVLCILHSEYILQCSTRTYVRQLRSQDLFFESCRGLNS